MATKSKEAKKRKITEENRTFHATWEMDFAFTVTNGHPMCLICQNTISVLKKVNLQRHHTTLHAAFSRDYPVGTKIREDKVTSLKKILQGQQNVFNRLMSSSDCATEASLHISWVLARKQKPYIDGETVKICLQESADSLFAEFKNKDDIKKQIDNLQLSHQTIARRVQMISNDIHEQFLFELNNASGFSLSLDLSSDLHDKEQLMIWVRFDVGDIFKEDLLALISLNSTTRGEDIYAALKECLLRNSIDLNKLISLTTDGAPAMVGRKKGLVGLLLADNDFPKFQVYHCIIHQQVLCSKLKEGALKDVMDVVVKIVNYILANPLRHRQFRLLLEEYESNYGDLVSHNDIRWLSKGKVLERFCNLYDEVKIFLSINAKDELSLLKMPKFIVRLAFLTDITSHLNKLNLKLQGRNQILPTLVKEINIFETKLDLFICQLKQSDFTHFPNLSKVSQEFPDFVKSEQLYLSLEKLKFEFSGRFEDIRNIIPLLFFVENPFTSDLTVVSNKMQSLGGDLGAVQLEIIEMQHNMTLREKHRDTPTIEFWMTHISSDEFPNIRRCCIMILTMFGSTYVCEAAFSAMTTIKSKKRNLLTDEHLENLIRAAVTEYQPRIKVIANKIQSQSSH